MDNDRERYTGKVIVGKFKADMQSQKHLPAHSSPHSTNPLYGKLLKLMHTKFGKHNTEYNTISNFRPEDLK